MELLQEMHKSWETIKEQDIMENQQLYQLRTFSLRLTCCQLLLNLTLGFPFCFQENL